MIKRHRKFWIWRPSTSTCLRERFRPTTISLKSWGSTVCKRSNCYSRIENHFNIELPDYEVQGRERLPHSGVTDSIPPVMLDLAKYPSIGAALKDALDQFANEICLIESDREREKERLTYRDFKDRALPLASALQAGRFKSEGSRRDHHDESVEVAHLGLRHFLPRRHAGSARLQADAG